MSNKSKFKVGSKVYWKWLGRKIEGKVLEVHFLPIIKEIKGKKIKRNGSPEVPAYYVESIAGNTALKLQSELFESAKPQKKSASKKPTPKIFS